MLTMCTISYSIIDNIYIIIITLLILYIYKYICINETLQIIVENLNLSSYYTSLNSKQYNWIRTPFIETSSDFGLTL